MSEQPWKRSERAVASALGGQRVPVSGRARGDAPDVAHPWLSAEVKHRRAVPAWLKSAVAQAVAAATPHQLPIVVLHQEGDRHDNDLVVLTLADFVEHFGPITREEDNTP